MRLTRRRKKGGDKPDLIPVTFIPSPTAWGSDVYTEGMQLGLNGTEFLAQGNVDSLSSHHISSILKRKLPPKPISMMKGTCSRVNPGSSTYLYETWASAVMITVIDVVECVIDVLTHTHFQNCA